MNGLMDRRPELADAVEKLGRFELERVLGIKAQVMMQELAGVRGSSDLLAMQRIRAGL
jgi:hypothetical protein